MIRRKYLQHILHQALLTTVSEGIHVRKTFVMSQQKNYPRPFAKAEIMEEGFDYERDESDTIFLKDFNGLVYFGVYAGVAVPTHDTGDDALLEEETERVGEILTAAIHNFQYDDTTLDNGARLLIRNVYITEIFPSVLDNELQGNLLLKGVIEYSHNSP